MTELRNIIVNATSEMLDEPDENGIYKTGRFYDRLESEITEHLSIQPDPVGALLRDAIKNSPHLTERLQDAVATYVDFQAHPPRLIASKLFGKDFDS
jgi:hypothetical protein